MWVHVSGPYGGEGRGQYPDGGTAGSESLTHGPGVSAHGILEHPAEWSWELSLKGKVIKRILGPWCCMTEPRCALQGLLNFLLESGMVNSPS